LKVVKIVEMAKVGREVFRGNCVKKNEHGFGIDVIVAPFVILKRSEAEVACPEPVESAALSNVEGTNP
jgi:hypothetical protein